MDDEISAVKSIDLNLYSTDGRLALINWLIDLHFKFTTVSADVWQDDNGSVLPQKERFSQILKSMIAYITLEISDVLKNSKPIHLTSKSWPSQDFIALVSALKGFPYTCFTYTDRYRASKIMKANKHRWFLADIVGDGICPTRFHVAFTHKECREYIVKDARFCTTGMSRTGSTSSNLCHFYPIATHVKDMSCDYKEALQSLAKSLFNNKGIAQYRFKIVIFTCKIKTELVLFMFSGVNIKKRQLNHVFQLFQVRSLQSLYAKYPSSIS